jgi:Trk K+ transport system NAD-binding subunit
MRGKGIIAAITTNCNRRIIPTGNYTLKEGDHVLVSVGGGKTKFIQQLFIKDAE